MSGRQTALLVVLLVAAVAGAGIFYFTSRGVDAATTTCDDLRGDADSMSAMARAVQDEINDADTTTSQARAYLAYACYGKANQRFKPFGGVIQAATDTDRFGLSPPPAPETFVRCYVRPTNAGCAMDEIWPPRCGRTLEDIGQVHPDFVEACQRLVLASYDGRLARSEYP